MVAAPKDNPASVSKRQGRFTVHVTGPEVATVRVKVGTNPWQPRTPDHYPGTAWGVLVVESRPKQLVGFVDRSAAGRALSYRQHYRLRTG